jgi:hypothetical protein
MTTTARTARWRESRIARGAVTACTLALPAIVTCALVAVLFHKTLLDYFPDASDELAYYHQIATFARVGFNGGYYSFEEAPAPLSASHFGVHGPAFAVLYGMPARVVGWAYSSGPLFNLVALALATAIFIVVTRPTAGQIAVIGIVIATSWWVILMLSSTMQETLNQAFMIVVAAFAVRLLRTDVERPAPTVVAALSVLAVASVLRPTNWLVAPPVVLIGLRRRPGLAALAALAATLGIPAFWVLWRYLSAPIPNLALEPSALGSIGAVFGSLLESLRNNRELFELDRLMASPFRQYVLFEAAGLAALSGVLAVTAAARAMATRRTDTSSGDLVARVPLNADVFNLVTLGTALLAFLGFYFDSQASISRVTAPFVLLSMLVLVMTRYRLWVVGAVVAANILVAPSFVEQYREWRSAMFGLDDREAIDNLRQQMQALIPYQPGKDPWCNTLLTMVYPPAIITVPAGIGLSMATRRTPSAEPVKSRYLLLSDNGLELYGGATGLRHLAKTVLGDLYLNPAAPCGSPAR